MRYFLAFLLALYLVGSWAGPLYHWGLCNNVIGVIPECGYKQMQQGPESQPIQHGMPTSVYASTIQLVETGQITANATDPLYYINSCAGACNMAVTGEVWGKPMHMAVGTSDVIITGNSIEQGYAQ